VRNSPADRVRERLDELRVVPPSGETVAEESSDVIDVRGLHDDAVEISDRSGNLWVGTADRALGALADMEPTGDPSEVWARLDRPA